MWNRKKTFKLIDYFLGSNMLSTDVYEPSWIQLIFTENQTILYEFEIKLFYYDLNVNSFLILYQKTSVWNIR